MAYNNNSKAARRRRRRRRRILQAVLPVIIAIVLIVVVALVGIKTGLFDSFNYSNKKADLNSYFQCMSQDTATVISDGEMTEKRYKVRDGRLYCNMDEVSDNFVDNFYWEDTSGRLLFTTGNGVYVTTPDATYYSLDGNGVQTGYTTCYKAGDELMLCLDYVREFSDFEYILCGGSGEPYRTSIKTSWGSRNVADIVKDDIAIRIEPDKQADILRDTKKGMTVTVEEVIDEDWSKVTTDDLITGYVENRHISDTRPVTDTPVSGAKQVIVNPVADYSKQIVLAWHNVTTEAAADYLKDYTKYLDNINTIAPTWFALADNDGTVASIASQNYVSMCHDRGISVWGVFDNITYPEVSTYKVMSNPEKRAKVIEQVLNYAAEYNLEGINLDFEMVTTDAGPHYVQFIREFSLAAHKQNIIVSVDNYVPKDYSKHYNRKEQGVFADYVIIMGYDEHTSGSEEAGSVASIDFVLDGIEQTISEVPKQKVINALPFYTRLWTVDDNGMILDVKNLPMDQGMSSVANAGATKKWDETTNQNYAEWSGNGGTNKIWLEDDDSLRSKLEVMKTQGVNGVAVWQLAYSTGSAWEVINEYYNP